MKVIIAGSRTISDPDLVRKAIKSSRFKITEVVCGGARGVDQVGADLATQYGIPIKQFPAEWKTFGRSAGFRRNAQMGEYADALIAVTTGSTGTANMISIMSGLGKPIYVIRV